MNKPSVSTIASIAEIVASVAVVVSLVLVVRSVDQNTAAVRATNDNMLFQFNDSQLRDVISDPEFARLLHKAWNSDEELDEVEEVRMDHYYYRDIVMWEIAFNRHSEGLMSPYQWKTWDKTFRYRLLDIPVDKWEELMTVGWGDEFLQYADTAYSEYQQSVATE